MKKSMIFMLAIWVVGMVFLMPISTFSQGNRSIPGTRWDLMMIKEAPIWKNLLKDYSLAGHQRFWPLRKLALEKILKEFPESQWADDAALILACGKASFENDMPGAIADLERIKKEYPDGQTIVALWDMEDGCRFDETWLMWQGGLVFLNKDGSIRTAKPFDKDGEISQPEKEALSYFAHLERCPIKTNVMAGFFEANIQYLKGDKAEAIASLEKIVSDSREYLAQINKADRIAASRPDGYYIRQLNIRPEYRAYQTLIGYYEKQDMIDKATAKASELSEICSKDGWFWTINRLIGDFYKRHDMAKKAEEQYQLALSGLNNFKMDIEKRGELVTGTDFPDSFWENTRNELEKKLNKKQVE